MDPLTLFHKRIQQYSKHIPPSHLRKYLGKNPALTIEMVLQDMKKNPDQKEYWTFERLYKTIPLEQLVAHNILPKRNSEGFECTEGCTLIQMKITIDTILKTHTILKYNWTYLIQHPKITIEDIIAHPELPWDDPFIGHNPNFRFEHLSHFPDVPQYVWKTLSRNATYEQIVNHPDKPWLSYILSSPHIHKHHIKALLPYLEQKFPYIIPNEVSFTNPNLSFDDFYELFGDTALCYANRCKNFTYIDYLKYEPKITKNITFFRRILPMSVLKSFPPHKMWMTWNDTIQFNKTLSYESLKHIPKDIIKHHTPIVNEWYIRKIVFDNRHVSHFDKKRLLQELLPQENNPYWIPYTVGDIRGFPSDIETLFESPLFLEPSFEEIGHYFAGKRIVRCVVECLTNPEYQQCRKRLNREFSMLS